MPKYEEPEIAAQIAKIRAEIARDGESRVGCDEMRFLCDDIANGKQFTAVAQIAKWEHWSFEFRPDGSVRFASV